MLLMSAIEPPFLLYRVSEFFPEISAWTYWCYTQPPELCFGDHRILASAGVQQGDPLGPLLFSLVVLDFDRSTGLLNSTCLFLWYLDDGTSVFSGCFINIFFRGWTSFRTAFKSGKV